MSDIYHTLHHACAALGTRLFTITLNDEARSLTWRAYTSHPQEYPLHGTKPLTRDGWYAACITARQTFVANTPPEFARYFFDHALITSMGLGSCVNIPVGRDPVLGTINLLAGEAHFTPPQLALYQATIAPHLPALIAAMQADIPRATA